MYFPHIKHSGIIHVPAGCLHTHACFSSVAWGWLPWYVVAIVSTWMALDALWCLAHRRPVAHRWILRRTSILRGTSIETTVILSIGAVLFDTVALLTAVLRYSGMIDHPLVGLASMFFLLCFLVLRWRCFPVRSAND